MKISTYKVDSSLIEEGGWIDFSATLGEEDAPAFLVRGKATEEYQERLFVALAKVPVDKRVNGRVSPWTVAQIEGELIGELLVLDWRGLTEDDGTPIEFSRERAVEFCTHADYRPLRALIELAVNNVVDMGRKTLEIDLGNFETSSAGNSDGERRKSGSRPRRKKPAARSAPSEAGQNSPSISGL